MKLCVLSLSTAMVLALFTACGGEEVADQPEREASQPQTVESEPTTPVQETYLVQPGDTLQALAKEHYGNEHYDELLMLHNNLAEPEDLVAGTRIDIPDFKGLVEGEEISKIFEPELALLFGVREKYLGIEARLWEIRRNVGRGRIDLPVELSSTLDVCSADVGKALEGFSEIREGVVYEPRGLLSQLRMLRDNLANLATGSNDGYGYDLDMVHQRLSIALTYGIVWSRHGFR